MSAENKKERPWDSPVPEFVRNDGLTCGAAVTALDWLADQVDAQNAEIEALKKDLAYAFCSTRTRVDALEAQQSGNPGQVLYAEHLKKMEAMQAQHFETLATQQQAVADIVINGQQPEPPSNPRQLPYAERLERMVCAFTTNPASDNTPWEEMAGSAAEALDAIDAHLAGPESVSEPCTLVDEDGLLATLNKWISCEIGSAYSKSRALEILEIVKSHLAKQEESK